MVVNYSVKSIVWALGFALVLLSPQRSMAFDLTSEGWTCGAASILAGPEIAHEVEVFSGGRGFQLRMDFDGSSSFSDQEKMDIPGIRRLLVEGDPNAEQGLQALEALKNNLNPQLSPTLIENPSSILGSAGVYLADLMIGIEAAAGPDQVAYMGYLSVVRLDANQLVLQSIVVCQ